MFYRFVILFFGFIHAFSSLQAQNNNPFSSTTLTRDEWEQRKDSLINCFNQFLPVNLIKEDLSGKKIILSSKRSYEKYSVRNFALQTLNGLYICGSVYTPVNIKSRLPLVLAPNGHFGGGRYTRDQQLLCGTLASMNTVAVSYDMFGWGESRLQFKESDHYTPTAMFVQLLNCSALLDYFCSQSYIDTSKILITGASGGGSQAILNTALDKRIKYSIPVVMLSASFPGGCPCENGIPIRNCNNGTNNAEIAAFAAPRNQLIVSCGNDWTKTVPEKEFPFLQQMYKKYGAENNVSNIHLPGENHDFGIEKRKAVYQYINEWFYNISGSTLTDDAQVIVEEEEKLFAFGKYGDQLPANAIKSLSQLNKLIISRIPSLQQLLIPPSVQPISIDSGTIHLFANGREIASIDSIAFNHIVATDISVVEKTDSSWTITLEFPEYPVIEDKNSPKTKHASLNIKWNGKYFHLSSAPSWGSQITIYLKDNNDHYFGLIENLYPHNKKSPDLRGAVVDIDIEGPQYSYLENFSSAWSAFYFNTGGYASFMNTFAKGRYMLGINGSTTLMHETGKLDWYLFTGDHFNIYQQYYSVIGAPKKVPLWNCGPIVWRDENRGGANEIQNDLKKFDSMNIPVTAIMVDRPYSNGNHGWSKMDFSSSFDQPQKWIANIRKRYGAEIITWIAPATFSDTNFPGLLHGNLNYIDLTNPSAVKEFGSRLANQQHKYGVRGHKMDRADEEFPLQESWYDRTPKAERRNKYAYLYAKFTDSILQSSFGNNQVNFARTAIHGTQPYLTALWGGDPRSTWDGMAGNMANAIRCSFMGFSNWGTDVGGYRGSTGQIPDALYKRWLQWGAFNGLFEIKIDGEGGNGADRAPWNCSVDIQQSFKNICQDRMQWLPHIFSQLNTADVYGPLMKPLAMIYPNDKNTYPIWDQYIFGNTLLVAPIFSEDDTRKIYLPEGRWVDNKTNKILNGNQWINYEADPSAIPTFNKCGSLQLKGDIYRTASPNLDIIYYPQDGETAITYVDGTMANTAKISARTGNFQSVINIAKLDITGTIKIFCETVPNSLFVDGRKKTVKVTNGFLVINRTRSTSEVVIRW